MLSKLIKQDLRAMSKLMLPLLGLIVLEVALIGALIGYIASARAATSALSLVGVGVGVGILALGVFACNIMMIVLIYVRFYKNLFTDQGYLSFTLPVTPTQHLCSKTISAIIWQILIIFVDMLAILIALLVFMFITGADVMGEIVKFYHGIAPFISSLIKSLEIDVLSTVIISIVSSIMRWLSSLFMIFFIITVGGLSKSYGALKGIGLYLGLGILGSIGSVIVNHAASQMPANLFLLPQAIAFLLLAIVFFMLTRWLLEKKLNLN